MTASVRAMGHRINPKRVRRLMRVMGLEAIYPKPRLSANGPDHKVYSYLLKGVTVGRPDQAWATDITYIRLAHGFVYLVAILDWYSRYVASWELSIMLDIGFCLEARTHLSAYFGVHGKNGIWDSKWIKWSQEAGSQSTFNMPLRCPKNGERVTLCARKKADT